MVVELGLLLIPGIKLVSYMVNKTVDYVYESTTRKSVKALETDTAAAAADDKTELENQISQSIKAVEANSKATVEKAQELEKLVNEKMSEVKKVIHDAEVALSSELGEMKARVIDQAVAELHTSYTQLEQGLAILSYTFDGHKVIMDPDARHSIQLADDHSLKAFNSGVNLTVPQRLQALEVNLLCIAIQHFKDQKKMLGRWGVVIRKAFEDIQIKTVLAKYLESEASTDADAIEAEAILRLTKAVAQHVAHLTPTDGHNSDLTEKKSAIFDTICNLTGLAIENPCHIDRWRTHLQSQLVADQTIDTNMEQEHITSAVAIDDVSLAVVKGNWVIKLSQDTAGGHDFSVSKRCRVDGKGSEICFEKDEGLIWFRAGNRLLALTTDELTPVMPGVELELPLKIFDVECVHAVTTRFQMAAKKNQQAPIELFYRYRDGEMRWASVEVPIDVNTDRVLVKDIGLTEEKDEGAVVTILAAGSGMAITTVLIRTRFLLETGSISWRRESTWIPPSIPGRTVEDVTGGKGPHGDDLVVFFYNSVDTDEVTDETLGSRRKMAEQIQKQVATQVGNTCGVCNNPMDMFRAKCFECQDSLCKECALQHQEHVLFVVDFMESTMMASEVKSVFQPTANENSDLPCLADLGCFVDNFKTGCGRVDVDEGIPRWLVTCGNTIFIPTQANSLCPVEYPGRSLSSDQSELSLVNARPKPKKQPQGHGKCALM